MSVTLNTRLSHMLMHFQWLVQCLSHTLSQCTDVVVHAIILSLVVHCYVTLVMCVLSSQQFVCCCTGTGAYTYTGTGSLHGNQANTTDDVIVPFLSFVAITW